jgi:nucleoside-diphosphate-sugar epimerase
MPTNKTALVTGASGFIGRPLTAQLEREGWLVLQHSAADGDIASCPLPFPAVEHVFHLAAQTFVPDSWAAPLPFYTTNVLGTVNVAEFCRRTGASMTMLSSYVYGRPVFLPISEAHPLAAFNPYGHSKILAEQVCSYYAAQFGARISILRPFNVYGWGQAPHFLVPTLIRQALDPKVHEISLADDRPRRDYLFIDDLIDLLVLTTAPQRCDVYNAGSGCSASPREVAELVASAAGVAKPIVSRGETRADEVLEMVADIGKATKEFGWTPRVSLANGLARTVQAFTRNP